MIKFWWKGEPLIVGSLHWQVIDNDLKNTIKDVLSQLKPNMNIEEAVGLAHKNGLKVSFHLVKRT